MEKSGLIYIHMTWMWGLMEAHEHAISILEILLLSNGPNISKLNKYSTNKRRAKKTWISISLYSETHTIMKKKISSLFHILTATIAINILLLPLLACLFFLPCIELDQPSGLHIWRRTQLTRPAHTRKKNIEQNHFHTNFQPNKEWRNGAKKREQQFIVYESVSLLWFSIHSSCSCPAHGTLAPHFCSKMKKKHRIYIGTGTRI